MIYIILGISLIIFGTGIIVDPSFYDSKHGMHHDFTGIEWYYGGLLVILGIAFIWAEIRKRIKKTEN